MVELVELSNTTHKHLKVVPDSKIAFAQSQQIMRIRVNEVPQAATDFPVVFTRNGRDGSWVLSILTGIGQYPNVFVQNQTWTATFQPSAMQTHPLYLIRSPKDENAYTIGIDAQSDAFSSDSGEPLFDSKGAPSLYLSKLKGMLENGVKGDIATHNFTQAIEQLGLLKPIDLNITYGSGSNQKMAGLYVLDEAKLQQLTGEQLEKLSKAGFLVPMHAMLISLYQMNSLIRRNNVVDPSSKITQLKMEVAKDNVAY